MAKSAVGLYINDGWIEIAQVNDSGRSLLKFGRIQIPQGIIAGGEVVDRGALANAIKQLMAEAKPEAVEEGLAVTVGVSEKKVFLREFEVPKLQPKQTEEAVEWNIRSLAPVLPAEIETDWEEVAEGTGFKIVLTAIPLKTLEDYVAAVEMAGLTVEAVEPAMRGIVRLIDPGQINNRNVVVLYLAENYLEMLLVRDGLVRFNSVVETQELEARGGWAKAVENFIAYVRSKYSGREIEELLMMGAGRDVSSLKGTEVGGVKMGLAKPRLSQVKVSKMSIGETTRTVIGLALKRFDLPVKPKRGVNLLPGKVKFRGQIESLAVSWRNSLWVVGGISLLILLLGLAARQVIVFEKQRLMNVAEQIRADGDVDEKKLVEQINQMNELATRLQLISATMGDEEKIIDEILLTSEGIKITSLIYERGKIPAKNIIASGPRWSVTGTAATRDQVVEFYQLLITKDAFSEGRLFFGSLEKQTEVPFRIASPI